MRHFTHGFVEMLASAPQWFSAHVHATHDEREIAQPLMPRRRAFANQYRIRNRSDSAPLPNTSASDRRLINEGKGKYHLSLLNLRGRLTEIAPVGSRNRAVVLF